jgi:hypothetical protein
MTYVIDYKKKLIKKFNTMTKKQNETFFKDEYEKSQVMFH